MIDAAKREQLKKLAIEALPHEHRDEGDSMNATFALLRQVTPEIILSLLGEEIPELPIREPEIEE